MWVNGWQNPRGRRRERSGGCNGCMLVLSLPASLFAGHAYAYFHTASAWHAKSLISFCLNAQHTHTNIGECLQTFDAEFVKVDQSTLFDLILAANYLNIKGLLDLTCQTVAQMIKGKTPEVS